ADGQEFDGVPFAGLVFVIGILDDARVGARLAFGVFEQAWHGVLSSTLLVLDGAKEVAVDQLGFDIDDGIGDGPVVAAILFLDLAFLRALPVAAGRSVLADAVVEQAAVAHRFFARRPALLAPL